MNGKQKCKILREIRSQIAQENDIDLVIAECTHKGECRGTCPRCEAEVSYLERELDRRAQLKKRVALAGISAGLTLALAGCQPLDAVISAIGATRQNPPATVDNTLTGMLPAPTDHIETLDGEVAIWDGGEAEEDG